MLLVLGVSLKLNSNVFRRRELLQIVRINLFVRALVEEIEINFRIHIMGNIFGQNSCSRSRAILKRAVNVVNLPMSIIDIDKDAEGRVKLGIRSGLSSRNRVDSQVLKILAARRDFEYLFHRILTLNGIIQRAGTVYKLKAIRIHHVSISGYLLAVPIRKLTLGCSVRWLLAESCRIKRLANVIGCRVLVLFTPTAVSLYLIVINAAFD